MGKVAVLEKEDSSQPLSSALNSDAISIFEFSNLPSPAEKGNGALRLKLKKEDLR